MRGVTMTRTWPGGKIGKRQIALIHTALNVLGMTKAEKLEVYAKVGVATSKDLTWAQFDELMTRFRAGGFFQTNPRKPYTPPQTTWDKQEMLTRIGSILDEIGSRWTYANAISRRMFKVDVCSWCTPEQLHSIVAALEYKRQQVMGTGPGKSLKRLLKPI